MRLSLAGEDAMLDFGRSLAGLLAPGDVVLLEGQLGAGKTTLVRGVARGLGLPPDEVVTSPTFAIVQDYDTDPPLVHADLYRMRGPRDLDELGLEELMAPPAIALLEWAFAFERALPRVDAIVRIDGAGGDERSLDFEPRSARGEVLVAAVRALTDAASRET